MFRVKSKDIIGGCEANTLIETPKKGLELSP